MAALLKRGLEHEGYAVDLAADGGEALWAAREFDFDAIVLDPAGRGSVDAGAAPHRPRRR